MTNPAPRQHGLSAPAAAAFAEFKAFMLEKHEVKLSSSTAIEFLVWHYEQTRDGGPPPAFSSFKPETRKGRPQMWAIEKLRDRPVAPSTIRKLAGLDRSVWGRKL